MILVLLGTQNNSFHRLLEELDKLVEKKIIDEKIIVQAGYTKYESKNMKIFGLIPQEKLEKYQEKADLIIINSDPSNYEIIFKRISGKIQRDLTGSCSRDQRRVYGSLF